MFYFEIVLIVLFLIATILGYKKNNRNMMLIGSVCLVIAVSAEPFMKGFNKGFEGYKSEMTTSATEVE